MTGGAIGVLCLLLVGFVLSRGRQVPCEASGSDRRLCYPILAHEGRGHTGAGWHSLTALKSRKRATASESPETQCQLLYAA